MKEDLCLVLKSLPPQEFHLITTDFDVFMNEQNFNAVADFICRYAGVFI